MADIIRLRPASTLLPSDSEASAPQHCASAPIRGMGMLRVSPQIHSRVDQGRPQFVYFGSLLGHVRCVVGSKLPQASRPLPWEFGVSHRLSQRELIEALELTAQGDQAAFEKV